MFCSKSCKKVHEELTTEPLVNNPYRIKAKHPSFLEMFYASLANKENFCIICGKDIKQESSKAFNMIAGTFIFLSTLIPITMVLIDSKPMPPAVVSLLVPVEPNQYKGRRRKRKR